MDLSSELAPIRGILAGFLASERGRATLGVHRLPFPSKAALLGVVFDHLLHQLLEDAHPRPFLETLVDDARGDPEPIAVDGLPLAAGPEYVPDAINDGSIGSPGSATPLRFLPLFGQALLDLPPERSWESKVIDPLSCVSLPQGASPSRTVTTANPFSERCVFRQASRRGSRIDSKCTHPASPPVACDKTLNRQYPASSNR